MSDVGTLAGMMSSSNLFSQDAIGKKFSKTYESSASDDYMSCASGTDELEDNLMKNGKKSDKHSDTKDKQVNIPTSHSDSVRDREAANGFICSDRPLSATNSTTKNEGMDVEAPLADGADDSDMVEQEDVKICDICGVAGREDLLAVCSRCSDGAEHTYCMQKKLDKVPEGEWLCEECKSIGGLDDEKQKGTHKLTENEKKGNLSAQASSEQGNSSDFGRKGAEGEIKRTGKRHRDDADCDVSSIAKKPATLQAIGSPKAKNYDKAAPSSPDSSIKNHDNGLLKSSHLSSSNASQVNDIPESTNPVSALQSQGSHQGSLSKSISFSSMASKRKVKLVDQAVLQSQKSAKEHVTKDGITRSMGKSVSFRSTSKMLPPRQSHSLDNTDTKERSSFERQRSFRSEQQADSKMGTSKNATPRIDIPVASRGESPIDVIKPIALPRSSSFVGRRSVESSSSIGEFKQSVISRSGVGVTYTNGFGKKSSHTVGERQHYNNNDSARDITNSGDRMREQLGPRLSTIDESRKPGVHWRHKVSDQADKTSVSIGLAEVASDHISRSTGTKRSYSDVINPAENKSSVNFMVNTLKQETISNVKKTSLVNSKSSLSGGDGFPLLSSSKDVLNDVSVTASLLIHSAAIPEHEYIWQGSFEINLSDGSFELWDGIQAHLSTRSSPKVARAVEKFESRVVLYEVPRLSTWPTQFHENGVKEDHIALFFFAKDIESYNKKYRNLVGKMMANDLALRGDVQGVELLIFPSNQLHDNMKRWNSLFYIWGVFRGKRDPSIQSSAALDEGHRTNTSTLEESDIRPNFSSSAAIQNNHQELDINSTCEPPFRDMMEKVSSQTVEAEAGAHSVASDGISGNGIVTDRVSIKEQPSIVIEEKGSSRDVEAPKRIERELKDLNMMPKEWDLNEASLTNCETRNKPCGALETMSHTPSVSVEYMENPERHFFAIESSLQQEKIQDKSPNLELALWAENKTLTADIGDNNTIAAEDDVSASLSLSLSFPLSNLNLSSED